MKEDQRAAIKERWEQASKRPASDPEVTPAYTACTTPEAIERHRMIVILQALNLESKGIRAFRGGSALSAARRLYGIKARDAATAYTRMRQLMETRGIIVHDHRPHEIGKEDSK